MKYPLDFKADAAASLLFWMERFLRHKLTTLNSIKVDNKEALSRLLKELNFGTGSINALSQICREARKLGIIGINTYASPLVKFYDYIKAYEAASLKEIDEDLLIDFLAIHSAGLSQASRRNYRIALIGFFSFIDKHNADDDNKSYIFNIELKNLSNAKATNKLPSYLTKDEIKAFLDAIENMPHDATSLRDRLLIKLIIHTGMRIGEALSLRLKDIVKDGDFYIIRVRGKGNKMRMRSVIASEFENAINLWLDKRAEIKNAHQSDYFFITSRANQMSQSHIYARIEKLLIYCGISKEKNGAHMLRHTYATQLYNTHKDLILVQESLGHASLDTSRIYTHFDEKKLKIGAFLMSDINKESE